MFTSVPRTLVVAAATAFASLLMILGGGPAAAHAGLQSSTPADGETLTAAPDAISLTFSSAVASGFARIAVTGPDGQSVNSGDASIDGAVVSQPVSSVGDGAYVVAYRVVSDDGHSVTGQLSFTLTGTGTGTGTGGGVATESAVAEPTVGRTSPARPRGTTAVSPAANSDAGGSWGLWLLVAAVALVIIVATWLALRRRSHTGG